MTRLGQITRALATVCLAFAVAIPLSAVAQSPPRKAPQERKLPNARPQQNHPMQQQQNRPMQPQGHAGDWLRRYKDLAPDEQEHALQNDPAFNRLPAERQQMLRQRLQHFSNLPPQQQLRMLNRMETWEHLTPEQKQEARQLYGKFRELPPARQGMVSTAVRNLRAMPPEQREQVINSDRFKGMFSDQEREIMRGAAHLPLAPAEGGENAESPEQQ